MADDLRIRIPVELDSSGITEQLKQITADVSVKLDTSDILAQMKSVQNEVKNNSAVNSIQITADVSSAAKAIREIPRLAGMDQVGRELSDAIGIKTRDQLEEVAGSVTKVTQSYAANGALMGETQHTYNKELGISIAEHSKLNKELGMVVPTLVKYQTNENAKLAEATTLYNQRLDVIREIASVQTALSRLKPGDMTQSVELANRLESLRGQKIELDVAIDSTPITKTTHFLDEMAKTAQADAAAVDKINLAIAKKVDTSKITEARQMYRELLNTIDDISKTDIKLQTIDSADMQTFNVLTDKLAQLRARRDQIVIDINHEPITQTTQFLKEQTDVIKANAKAADDLNVALAKKSDANSVAQTSQSYKDLLAQLKAIEKQTVNIGKIDPQNQNTLTLAKETLAQMQQNAANIQIRIDNDPLAQMVRFQQDAVNVEQQRLAIEQAMTREQAKQADVDLTFVSPFNEKLTAAIDSYSSRIEILIGRFKGATVEGGNFDEVANILNVDLEKFKDVSIFDGLDDDGKLEQLYRNIGRMDKSLQDAGKSFADLLPMDNAAKVKTLSGQIENFLNRTRKSATETRSQLSALTTELNNKNISIGKYKQISDEFGRIQIASRNAGETVKTLGDQFSAGIKKFAGWYSVSRVFMEIVQAMRQMRDQAIELDSQMNNLRMVTGASVEDGQAMLQTYSQIATELHTTTLAVAQSAEEWLRQGKTVAETNDLIRTTQVFAKVGFLENAEAAELLTSTLNGYQLSVEDAMSVVDKMSELDRVAATSTRELAEALQLTASSAKLSGVGLDEVLSYITTISETSRQSSQVVGTAVRTMFARINQVRAGASFDEEGESISNVESVLQKYNISLRDSLMEFRDTSDVLVDIAGKWDTLSTVEQNHIATTVAGMRARESFLILMSNFDKALGYQEVSLNAAGTALEKYEIRNESVQASLDDLNNQFQIMSTTFMTGDFLKFWIDLAANTLEVVNSMGGLAPALTTITGVVILLNKQRLDRFFVSIAESVPALISHLTDLGTSFKRGVAEAGQFASVFAKVSGGMREMGSSAKTAGGVIGFLANSFTSVAGVIGIAVTAISVITGMINRHNEAEREAIRIAAEKSQEYVGFTKSMDDYRKAIIRIDNDLKDGIITGQEAIDNRNELYKSQQTLIEGYETESTAIQLVTGDIREQINEIDRLSAEKMRAYQQENADRIRVAQEYFRATQDYGIGSQALFSDQETYQGPVGLYTSSEAGNEIRSNKELQNLIKNTEGFGDAVNTINGNVKLQGVTVEEAITLWRSLFDRIQSSGIDASGTLSALSEVIRTLSTDEEYVNNQQIHSTSNLIEARQKYGVQIQQLQSAQEAYYQAVESGEENQVATSLANLANIKDAIDKVLQDADNPAFTKLFDGLINPDTQQALKEFTVKEFVDEYSNAIQVLDDSATANANVLSWSDDMITFYEALKVAMGEATPEAAELLASLQKFAGVETPATFKNKLEELRGEFTEVASSFATITAAQKEFDDQGYVSTETLSKLVTLNEEYTNLLFNEQGAFVGIVSATDEVSRSMEENVRKQRYEVRSMRDMLSTLEEGSDAHERLADAIRVAEIAIERDVAQMDAMDAVTRTVVNDLSLITSEYTTLVNAMDEFNASGYIELETLKQLADAGLHLVQYLEMEDGQLRINEQGYLMLAQARIDEAKTAFLKNVTQIVANLSSERTAAENLTIVLGNLAQAELAAAQSGLQLALSAQLEAGALDAAAIQAINVEARKMSTLFDNASANIGNYTTKIRSAGKASKTAGQEIQEAISAMRDAFSNINSLLDTTMAMLRKDYDLQKEALQDQIDALDERYDLERDALDDLADKQNDYYDNIQDQIEAQRDAAKEAADDQKDALQEQLDAYRAMLEAQIELLQRKKEEDDYQRSIADKSKDIAKIQAELLEMQGDDSESTMRRRLELEEELFNKESDLSQTQADKEIDRKVQSLQDELDRYNDMIDGRIEAIDREQERMDQYYDDQLEALDRERENFEAYHQQRLEMLDAQHERERAVIDDQIQRIEEYLENEVGLREEAMALIDGKTQEFYDRLIEYNRLYGSGIDEEIRVQWEKAYTSMQQYDIGQQGVLATLNQLVGKMYELENSARSAASGAASAIGGVSNAISNAAAELAKFQQSANYAMSTADEAKYLNNFGNYGMTPAPTNQSPLAGGGSSNTSSGSGRNSASQKYVTGSSIASMSASEYERWLRGYSQGGLVKDTGLQLLHGKTNAPEMVLNATDSQKLFSYITETPNLIADMFKKVVGNIGRTDVNNVTNNNNTSQPMTLVMEAVNFNGVGNNITQADLNTFGNSIVDKVFRKLNKNVVNNNVR